MAHNKLTEKETEQHKVKTDCTLPMTRPSKRGSPVRDFIVLRSFNNEGKVETYHHEINKLPVSLAASDCRPTALCARERGDYAAAGKGVGGMAEATNLNSSDVWFWRCGPQHVKYCLKKISHWRR